MQVLKKAVFPVAGLGTRFLPATKANPKEMLPIVDKPLIQYAVEEAIEAGITELIFVTGRNKRSIEDHFDKAYELETTLEAKSKHALLEAVNSILPKTVSCIYIRQPEALGLGHAVLCARPVIGNEPFAVLLADDLIDAKPCMLKEMVTLFNSSQSSILGVEEVDPKEISSYGVVETESISPLELRVKNIIEKPKPEEAPSNLAVVGRYVFTARILHYLTQIKPGKSNEIQLTDGISALMKAERVLAKLVSGIRYDCGSKLGYLKATLAYGSKHPEVGEAFSRYLQQFIQENKGK